jgi:hypothetical protein
MRIKIIIEPIEENLKDELIFELKKIKKKFKLNLKLNSKNEIILKNIKEFKKELETIFLHSYLTKKIKINSSELKKINNENSKINNLIENKNNEEIILFENKNFIEKNELEFLTIIIKNKLYKLFEDKNLFLNINSIKYSLILFKHINLIPIYENYRKRFESNYYKLFKFNEKINIYQDKNSQFSILDNKKLKEIKEISSKENLKININILRPEFLEFKYEENKFNTCFIENIYNLKSINFEEIIEQLKYIIKKTIIIYTNKNNHEQYYNILTEYFKKIHQIELNNENYLIIIKNK